MLHSTEYEGRLKINGEQVRIWKKTVMTYMKVLPWHLSGEKDEAMNNLNQESWCPAKIQTKYFRNK
jgi:hypothetical protein